MINVKNVSLLGDYKTLMVEMVVVEEKGNHLLINKLRSGGRKLKKKGRIIASLKAEKNESNNNSNKDEEKDDSDEPKVQFNKGVSQRSKKN